MRPRRLTRAAFCDLFRMVGGYLWTPYLLDVLPLMVPIAAAGSASMISPSPKRLPQRPSHGPSP